MSFISAVQDSRRDCKNILSHWDATVSSMQKLLRRFMEWRQAEHPSLQFNIVGSVLSNTVDKEMNHHQPTSRETGGRGAEGLQQCGTTDDVSVFSDAYFWIIAFIFVLFNQMQSISVFPQPFIVLTLSASFDRQEGISRPLFVYFSSCDLNESLEAEVCFDEHFVPHTPLELWDSSALAQRQALIQSTMVTMPVLFLLRNKDLKVNKLEFHSVRSALSQHFFTGPIMTLWSEYQTYILFWSSGSTPAYKCVAPFLQNWIKLHFIAWQDSRLSPSLSFWPLKLFKSRFLYCHW